MRKSERSEGARQFFAGRAGLVLLLLLYFGIGAAFGAVVPLWEAPDERRHFKYARYLAENISLPPLSYELSENPATLAFHPPLYHALMAPLALGLAEEIQLSLAAPEGKGSNDMGPLGERAKPPYHNALLQRARLMRFASLLLGIIVVYCVWQTCVIAFADEPWLPFVATSLVALNPQFIFISSSINDQALSSALGAILLLAMTRTVMLGATLTRSLTLGLVWGASLLTSTSGILFAPVILTALFVSDLDVRKTVRSSIVIIVLAFAVAGWWYVRNLILLDDPFLWNLHREVLGKPFVRQSPVGGIEFLNILRLIHRSFWGVFGMMDVPLGAPIYWLLEIFTGLCCVGFARYLFGWKGKIDQKQFRLTLLFALSVSLFFASIVKYNLTFTSAQGRYLFIVIPAIGALGATGLVKGIGRKPALIAACVFLGMLALSLVALVFFIYPAYT